MSSTMRACKRCFQSTMKLDRMCRLSSCTLTSNNQKPIKISKGEITIVTAKISSKATMRLLIYMKTMIKLMTLWRQMWRR
ncbi:hypothetical protein AHAS_Ahas19G0084600 [Arachis hypogaea]